MGTYLLVEHQSGGCDYTIGCGTKVTPFEAESMEAALALVRANALDEEDGVGSELLDSDERERDRARVYEVSGSADVPLDEMREELLRWEREDEERVERERLSRASDAVERSEYERLRRKFDPEYARACDEVAVGTSVSVRVAPPVTAGEWPRRRS